MCRRVTHSKEVAEASDVVLKLGVINSLVEEQK